MQRNELVTQNLGIVRALAARCRVPAGLEREDLMSAGYIGLVLAAERWDPAKGVKFASYAWHFVKGHIWHAIRDADGGRYRREQRLRLDHAAERFFMREGREPTDAELCRELGCDAGVLARLRQAQVQLLSLDAPCSEDSSDTWADVVPDSAPLLLDMAAKADEEARALRALSCLPPEERAAVTLSILYDWTGREVGAAMGCSHEQARRLALAGLRRLRGWVA